MATKQNSSGSALKRSAITTLPPLKWVCCYPLLPHSWILCHSKLYSQLQCSSCHMIALALVCVCVCVLYSGSSCSYIELTEVIGPTISKLLVNIVHVCACVCVCCHGFYHHVIVMWEIGWFWNRRAIFTVEWGPVATRDVAVLMWVFFIQFLLNVAMHQSKGMLSKSLTGLRNTVAMWPGVLLHKFLHSPSVLSVPSCGVLKYFLEPFDQLIASADVYTIQRLPLY